MNAGVLDLLTPSGTAWWQWLVVFVVTAAVLSGLLRLAIGDGYSYAGPDGVAIAAAFGAGIVGLYALAGSIRFYDLKWPEDHLGAGLAIPLVAAGITAWLWFLTDFSVPQLALFVVFAVLTLAAIVWWVLELVEVASRAFAAAGGLGALLVAGALVALMMEKR